MAGFLKEDRRDDAHTHSSLQDSERTKGEVRKVGGRDGLRLVIEMLHRLKNSKQCLRFSLAIVMWYMVY